MNELRTVTMVNPLDAILGPALSENELMDLYTKGGTLRHVVINNESGKPISPKNWMKMMVLLESKGYTWKGGDKPTTPKIPPVMYRALWVTGKILTFAGAGYYIHDYFIKLDDFMKIIESE